MIRRTDGTSVNELWNAVSVGLLAGILSIPQRPTTMADDDIARRNIVHAAGANTLVSGEAGAVQQVERLASGHVFVRVDDAQVTGDAAALERERRHAANQTATTDDADFHGR